MEFIQVFCFITVWVACAAAKDVGLPQWHRHVPGFHTLLQNKEAIVRPMINLGEIQAEIGSKNLEEVVLFADKIIIDQDISLLVSKRTVIICSEMLVKATSTPNVNFGKGQVDVIINNLKGRIMLSSQAIENKEDLIHFLSTNNSSDLFLPLGEFVPDTMLHVSNYIITAFEINLRSNTDIQSILEIHASITNLVAFLRSTPRVPVYDILRKRLVLILQINPDTDVTPIIPPSGTKPYETAIETSLRAALHYLSSLLDSETNEDKNETIMTKLDRLNDQFKQGASIIRSARSNHLIESVRHMTWLNNRLKKQSAQLRFKLDAVKNAPLVVNAMKWLVSLPLEVKDCAVEDFTPDKELQTLLWRLCSALRSAVTVQNIKLDKMSSRDVDGEMTRQMQDFDREHKFDFPIEMAWEQIESKLYSLLNPISSGGPQLEEYWEYFEDALAILKEIFELSSCIKTLMIELTQINLYDSFFNNSVDISRENILQQRELFMLQRLSVILHFHDAQTQYDHLQTVTTPVTIAFSNMLRELDLRLKTIERQKEEKLKTSLKTVRYKIDAPLNKLFSGIGILHRIPLSSPEFQKLAMVRIRGVSLKLAGVDKTVLPDVQMKLKSSGYVYFDRSASGSTFEFSSLERVFPLVETNGMWSYDANDVRDCGTPFTEWIISAETNATSTITRSPKMITIQMFFKVRVQMTLLQPTVVKRSASKTQILGEMKGRSVTNGYDVVCSVTASKLNTLFKQRYDQIDHAGLAYNITTERVLRLSYSTVYNDTDFDVNNVYLALNLIVGPPLISFLANEPKQAQVHMDVLSGWMAETVVLTLYGKEYIYNFTRFLDSTPEKRPIINAKVPLSYFKGNVSNHNDVVLRFAEGAFDVQNLNVEFNVKVEMANKLKSHFIAHYKDMAYSLGTVIYETQNTPKYLRPTAFSFAGEKYGSDPGGMLSLYILTNHNDTAFRKFNRRETLDSVSRPMPSDKSASLIISSFVFMKLMVLPQLKSQLGLHNNLEVRDRNRGEAFFVSGKNTFNFGSTLLGFRDDGNYYRGVYKDLTLDVSNLNVQSKGESICINYNTKLTGLTASMLRKPWTGFPGIKDYSLDGTSVSISDCCTSFQVDSQQVISIKSNKWCSSTISNFPEAEWAGFTLADFFSLGLVRVLEKQLRRQRSEMNNAVRKSIQGQITIPPIKLEDVSVFAVSNLLFPNNQILDFQEVYTPGDMVVFGTVRDKL